MRIRALSVFEGVVYHCWLVDGAKPASPVLEVEALLRPDDADAEAGPLLLSVADYIVFAGGIEVARPHLRALAEQGRITQHLGADHIVFPTWERVGGEDLGGPAPTDDAIEDGEASGHPRPGLRIVPPPSD